MMVFTFKSRLRLLLTLLFFMSLLGGTRAQNKLIKGVESLAGINPMESNNWVTDTKDYNINADDKTFFLYNVGTGKFVNMGGAYGTHAALHTTPKYFFLFNNVPGQESTQSPTKLNLRTKQSTTKSSNYEDPTQSTDYMQYIIVNNDLWNPVAGVYFDRTYNNLRGGTGGKNSNLPGSNGWTFVRVGDTSSTTNFIYNIYQVVGEKNYYLVAQDADQYGNDVEAKPGTPDASDKNAQWKLISKGQYSTLFNQASADLSEPTDASFLLRDPDFSVNNRYVDAWNISGNFKLGTEKYYKTKDTSSGKLAKDYTDESKGKNYQLSNGRFFNACITSATGEFYQYVTVTKAGWFLFRCRGISNVTDANGHVNAVLYAQQYTDANFSIPKKGAYTSQSLNTFPQTVASATDKMLQAGKEFSQGNYENQVMLYVEPQEGASKYYIRFGVKVGDTSSSSAKGLTRATNTKENLTIFDTFRMLYAGISEEPELILDEDNTDLYYLTDNYSTDEERSAAGYTTPVDTYTNTTLHLMRKFKLNMWNTIILPVNLTYGQMKGAFGDDVKLAKLWQLTDNTMRFLTVEPSSDDDVMLKANKPYIIYPTKGPGASQAYTATLHHVEKDGNKPAVNWTGTYQGKTVEGGKITIEANHYQISKVTLDKSKISKDSVGTTWVPTNSYTATNNKGTMTTQGTLAKTYETTSIISGRETCEGSYIMSNGVFYLVPTGKQYGLKAFRTWFKYKPKSGGTSKPTNFSFFINDDEVPATAIQDLFVDEPAARVVAIPGVYSLTGERLRMGNDLTGLPSGIYIMNGQKYVIK